MQFSWKDAGKYSFHSIVKIQQMLEIYQEIRLFFNSWMALWIERFNNNCFPSSAFNIRTNMNLNDHERDEKKEDWVVWKIYRSVRFIYNTRCWSAYQRRIFLFGVSKEDKGVDRETELFVFALLQLTRLEAVSIRRVRRARVKSLTAWLFVISSRGNYPLLIKSRR